MNFTFTRNAKLAFIIVGVLLLLFGIVAAVTQTSSYDYVHTTPIPPDNCNERMPGCLRSFSPAFGIVYTNLP